MLKYSKSGKMKLLEKALKDAMKEKKRSLGTKQVLNSIKSSKLIVMSQSVPKNTAKTIQNHSRRGKKTKGFYRTI